MNILAKTLAATTLLLSSLSMASASTLKEAADATYKLYSGNDGICSMTFVGNDSEGAIFLTAAHCVDGKELNFRIQKKNEKYEVVSEEIHYLKVLRANTSDDTAILQVTDPEVAISGASVDIATVEESDKVEFGQELFVLGFPAADEKSLTRGNFTAKKKGVLGVTEMYQTTVPIAGGNSGGGLYIEVDGEYKLIGTTSAKHSRNEIMTYFSTAEAVRRVLAGFLNNTSASPIDLNTLPGGRVGEK